MISSTTLEHLIGLNSRIEEYCTIVAKCAAETNLTLQKELLARQMEAAAIAEHPDPSRSNVVLPRPITDASTKTIRWCGRGCKLGHSTLFKLFERLSRHPDMHVSYEQLLSDVWGARKADETIRSAIRHLRRRLKRAGMGEIAAAIHGQSRHYVLRLEPSE